MEEARQYSVVITDLAFALGPGILGLPLLIFLAVRLRHVAKGEVRDEYGQTFHRIEKPSSYWFYVGLYVMGAIISILMVLWSAAWLAYVWEYRP